MAKLTAGTVVILVWAAVLLVFGFVYETSYFAALGLSAFSTLGVRHFIYSGFTSTVIPLLFLLGLSLLVKFFSKHIERNDAEAFAKSAKEFGFKQSLSMARFVSLICAAIWLFSLFEDRLFEMPHAWFGVPWLMFFVLQTFAFAIYTSPPHSRGAVFFAFFVALGLCISAWAVGSARIARGPLLSSEKIIRDDGIVRITREGKGFLAEAKAIRLPLPLLEKIAATISGEGK